MPLPKTHFEKRYATEKAVAVELGIEQRYACVVGSTLICDGGNDVDVLCLVLDDSVLADAGFVRDDYGHYQDLVFASWRRGDLNIIATPCSEFFFAEVAIAHAAKIVAGGGTFNMNTRAGRVAFHADIRGSVLMRFKQLEG
jgi:hypothetical protein